MATIHFGTGLYHSKQFVTVNSSTGQGFRSSPSGTLTYTAGSVSGLISGRNGANETYPYGVEVEAEPTGRTATYNANGLSLHPIITFATTKTGSVYERYLAGGPAGSTVLNIYSGTKPTSTDSITNLLTIPDGNQTKLLVSFAIPAGIAGIKCVTHDMYNAQNVRINNTYKNPGEFEFILGICNTKNQATSSGIATWFWFGNVANPTDLSDTAFVIGSIGTTDDGSCDMYMPANNIEQGMYYMSSGFRFKFPSIINV